MLFYLRYLEPLTGIFGQKQFHQFSCITFQILWKIQLPSSALFHDRSRVAGLIFVLERCEPTYEFADKDADAPYVSLIRVACIEHDLWCAIARCSTIGIRSIFGYVFHLLREPKIR